MASALRRQKSRSKLEEGRRIAAMGLPKINLGRFRSRYMLSARWTKDKGFVAGFF